MNAIMLKQSLGKLIGKIWQDAKFSACITMRLDMDVRAERTTFAWLRARMDMRAGTTF